MATYEETIAARIEKLRGTPARTFLRRLHEHTESAYQLLLAWERAERAGVDEGVLSAEYPDEFPDFTLVHATLVDWRDAVLKAAEAADAADPEIKVELECDCGPLVHGYTTWTEKMRRSDMKDYLGASCARNRMWGARGKIVRVTEVEG